MTDMLQVALEYSRHDAAVLPLKENKEPLIRGGHDNATADEAQVRKYWAQHPKALIGRLVGEDANLIVLDIESVEGHGVDGFAHLAQLEADYGPIRETTTIKTATGGEHYYFTFPEELKGKKLKKYIADGVELKSWGYVVTPGIVINGESYELIKGDLFSYADFPPQWVNLCIKTQPTSEDWERVRPRGSGRLFVMSTASACVTSSRCRKMPGRSTAVISSSTQSTTRPDTATCS